MSYLCLIVVFLLSYCCLIVVLLLSYCCLTVVLQRWKQVCQCRPGWPTLHHLYFCLPSLRLAQSRHTSHSRCIHIAFCFFLVNLLWSVSDKIIGHIESTAVNIKVSPEVWQVDRLDISTFDVITFKNVFDVFEFFLREKNQQRVFDAFNVFDVLRFYGTTLIRVLHIWCVWYVWCAICLAIYGHLAIRPSALNIGNRGIPEKNY